MDTKTGKRGRKAAPQPGLHRRRFDHRLAERVGQESIEHEHDKRHGHKDAAQKKKLGQGTGGIGGHELRKEGEEKDGQFGVEDVEKERLDNKGGSGDPRGSLFHRKSRLVLPRGIRDVEKIGYPRVLQGLEGNRAGVHDCRKAEDRGEEMGNDPHGAPQRRVDAGPSPLGQAGRDGEDDAGAGDKDDDEGGDQKFKAYHLQAPEYLWSRSYKIPLLKLHDVPVVILIFLE